jgi:hypothetical protein
MNKKITALAFAGFATLALSACSGNKAPTEERTGAAGSAAKPAASASAGNCRSIPTPAPTKGRNDAYLCSASAALNSAEAKEVLDPAIRVSYGNVGANTLTSRQVANAVGKTPEETCQRAFLNTVKRFQTTAAQRGSKSVRVISYFDKKTVGGGQYECHIGTWNSRVVLKGNL